MIKKILIFFLNPLILFGIESSFTPNFFGTLLELSSSNVEEGTATLEPYFNGGYSYGSYENNFSLNSQTQYGYLAPQMTAYFGLTSKIELDLMYSVSTLFANHKKVTGMGDLTLGFAYQFLFDDQKSSIPNFRVVLYGVFPTGQSGSLSPNLNGYDGTGGGCYGLESGFTLNKNFYTIPAHPFNLSINLTYTYLFQSLFKGISPYGGGPFSLLNIRPGPIIWSDLGFEIALTQELFFCLDLEYSHNFKNHFSGILGLNFDGSTPSLDVYSKDLFTIAPALEINITPDLATYIGVIATVFGRNSAATATANFSIAYSF